MQEKAELFWTLSHSSLAFLREIKEFREFREFSDALFSLISLNSLNSLKKIAHNQKLAFKQMVARQGKTKKIILERQI